MSHFDNDETPDPLAPYREPLERAKSEVGYRQPPVHSRFPKGRSGNPGGRPRGISGGRAAALIVQEAYRLIKVRDSDQVKKMPALRAIVRSQIKNALKATGRAQLEAIAMVQAAEQTLAAIAAAAAAAKAADEVDTSQVSDLDLARWILSILEGAADEQATKDAKEAAANKAARPQPAPSPAAPKAIPPPKGPDSESGSSNLH